MIVHFLTNQIDYTHNRLRGFNIDSRKILKLIDGLNPSKAHGHNGIFIRVMKLFSSAVTRSLSIIFQKYLKQGVFPDYWKKSYIISVHTKIKGN